jgi:hypothetical protein
LAPTAKNRYGIRCFCAFFDTSLSSFHKLNETLIIGRLGLTGKGKVMVSINDHPAIREVFVGLNMSGVDIKYSVAASAGQTAISKELVITNWDTTAIDSLF